MSQIDRLTKEQQARLSEWRDRWLAIGLSTEPADRLGARQGIVAAYAAAKLNAPVIFVWLRSPLEGVLGSWLLGQLPKKITHQVRGQVGGQVRGQVWDQVRGQVGGQVRGQFWDQVRGQVGGQVRGQFWDHENP